ncbi:hypothetical protein [Collimonas sp.]|jgi:hypothetical protein|uniref:hypothetical protein n=1 Tax=Collimonas sp. TaxID=1963772 RepID=UPI002CC71162|nr:hypothetical protein [Collimonas sp.]HWX03199.1 hypothetical protein [Collimonas sp.]
MTINLLKSKALLRMAAVALSIGGISAVSTRTVAAETCGGAPTDWAVGGGKYTVFNSSGDNSAIVLMPDGKTATTTTSKYGEQPGTYYFSPPNGWLRVSSATVNSAGVQEMGKLLFEFSQPVCVLGGTQVTGATARTLYTSPGGVSPIAEGTAVRLPP